MHTLPEIDPSTILTDEKTGIKYTTTPEEGAEYVSVAQYIRKRHEADLKKDAQALPLYDSSVRKVMRRGSIIALKSDIHFFIDWNRYKDFMFMRYGQLPKPKAPKTK